MEMGCGWGGWRVVDLDGLPLLGHVVYDVYDEILDGPPLLGPAVQKL